jgi:hypothetical protein
MSTHAHFRMQTHTNSHTIQVGIVTSAMCGAVAGAASVFGNTPVDVIKTRMQVCIPPRS